jgi:hypothetical protein
MKHTILTIIGLIAVFALIITISGCNIKESSIACSNECSSQGLCNTETGVCTCNDEWSGTDCSTEKIIAPTAKTCGDNMDVSGETCVCNKNYADCNSDETDGCEVYTLIDIKNCGECGKVCPKLNSMCDNGKCNCVEPFSDCDGKIGCETNTLTETFNCGACGYSCTAGKVCQDGRCTTTKKSVGDICTDNYECLSDNCLQAQHGKRCSTEESCGKCDVIDSQGKHCVEVQKGTDPKDDCKTESNCGTTGDCDGDGSCEKQDEGSSCEESKCDGNIFTPTRRCDGKGSCVETTEQNCNGENPCKSYSCTTTGCVSSNVADGAACDGGTCTGGVCA